MKSQGIKLILWLKVKLNWMRNCFNKLPSVNIVKSENIQPFCRRARNFFLSGL